MNSAFEALRGVKGLPSELRMASRDDPLFHLNDPCLIKGIHNELDLLCKPGVVLVSMSSARIAFDPDDNSAWSDYAFKTNAPNRNFRWNDILLTVDIKGSKPITTGPPLKYKRKAMESIEPQSLHSIIEQDEFSESESSPGEYLKLNSSHINFGK
jgi:hypothetical protein